ncbi:MAG: alpha-hydroxy-acid oxidizing enzyme [Dehalococcoidia bacterium]|nr:alpha-hydroxy-acid oxidizing enzyme [Dehalococcoidia bacterium]
MTNKLISLLDYENKAKQLLPKDTWQFISGGALDETTVLRNRLAINQRLLQPKRFQHAGFVDVSTKVLGSIIQLPVMISPAGSQSLAHDQAEEATASASSRVSTVMVVGTAASRKLETVRKVSNGLLWFQLYHHGTALTEMLIRRAEIAGYQALCVTVDVPYTITAEKDLRNHWKLPYGTEMANFTCDEAGLGIKPNTADARQYRRPPHVPVTWDTLEWIRSLTTLPIVIKGIMRADDAVGCVERGVQGVIVSNHGGRQLDGQASTIEVLPEIVRAVGQKCEVFVDGGFRRGIDVLKAVALGAKAVLIARPVFHGLAVAGDVGVEHVLTILRNELYEAMALCGVNTLAEVDRDLIYNCPSAAPL